ncbi:MAG TPA: class F sortase, partial [Jiangellaceae bacterium]
MPAKTTTYRCLRPFALAATALAVAVAAGCSGETGSPPDVGQPIPADSPTSAGDTGPTESPTGEGESSTGDGEGSSSETKATAREANHESEPLGAPIAMEFAGERSPVVSVGADEAAALQIPGDLDTVGWWKDGAEPGAAEGFVVITGHATQDGRAAANAWWDAEPGDRVV